MSLSCSDCFSDLLCAEDSSILSEESPEYSSDLDSPACSEESIASFIEGERNFVPGFEYLARFRSQSLDASARAESVAWILKVTPLTLTCAGRWFVFLTFLRLFESSIGSLDSMLFLITIMPLSNNLTHRSEPPTIPLFHSSRHRLF